MKKTLLFFHLMFFSAIVNAEDGYRVWLRYDKVDDPVLLQQYRSQINSIVINSPTLTIARNELLTDLNSLLDKKVIGAKKIESNCIVLEVKPKGMVETHVVHYDQLGEEGFAIINDHSNSKNVILITANTDVGVLYGVFHFLRLLQTHKNIQQLNIVSVPKIQNRILDHWDNLNRTVERGYAGASIWNWHLLPGYIDKRYIDYARANASIGINGTVLTNVNANAMVLTKPYLEKVAALANVFRPYGIKVYLTARFSAPIEMGGLKTADPLDPAVQNWWKQTVNEIYIYIPDFG